MTDREAMKMALEALESFKCAQDPIVPQSIHVLRQALAQPEQASIEPPDYVEPVTFDYHEGWEEGFKAGVQSHKRTAPPSKPWVSLTDAEIANAVGSPIDEVYLNDFRKVEAKLKEKNNG